MWRSIAKVFETVDPEDDAPEVAAEAEPASSLEEKAPSLLQRLEKEVPNAEQDLVGTPVAKVTDEEGAHAVKPRNWTPESGDVVHFWFPKCNKSKTVMVRCGSFCCLPYHKAMWRSAQEEAITSQKEPDPDLAAALAQSKEENERAAATAEVVAPHCGSMSKHWARGWRKLTETEIANSKRLRLLPRTPTWNVQVLTCCVCRPHSFCCRSGSGSSHVVPVTRQSSLTRRALLKPTLPTWQNQALGATTSRLLQSPISSRRR